MDYLALRIPVDTSKPITSHTVKNQPEPEEVEAIHSLVRTAPMHWLKLKQLRLFTEPTPTLEENSSGRDLYVDEEGLLKGRVRNWRASQLRYWWMKKREKDLVPNWREYAHIVGTACFVVPATDENIKIMGEILDS